MHRELKNGVRKIRIELKLAKQSTKRALNYVSKETLRAGINGSIFAALFLAWRPGDPSWNSMWIEPWAIFYFLTTALFLRFLYISGIKMLSLHIFCAYYALQLTRSSFQTGFHEQELQQILRSASMDQFIGLFCFMIFLLLRLDFLKSLKYAAWIVAAGVLLTKVPHLQVPFFHNPSMAATFVVLATGLNPIGLIAAYMTTSWTAAISYLSAMVYFLFPIVRKPAFWGSLLLASATLVYFGYAKIPDNGRFDFQIPYFKFWWDHSLAHKIFGLAPGTTRVYLLKVNVLQNMDLIQSSKEKVQFMTYIWAHNDWLQTLIELGIVGFSLACWFAADLWRRANEAERSVLLAFGIAMLSNFPVHWPMTALVGWSIVGRVVSRPTR